MKVKPPAVKGKRFIRVLLIDSGNKSVKIESWPKGELLKRSQDFLGGYVARGFSLPNGDSIMVDDEGLLKNPDRFFSVTGAHQPFAGNAVIWGPSDRHGNTTNARSSGVVIERAVAFLSAAGVASALAGH